MTTAYHDCNICKIRQICTQKDSFTNQAIVIAEMNRPVKELLGSVSVHCDYYSPEDDKDWGDKIDNGSF